MTNQTTPATPNNRQEFAAALAKRLTEDEAAYLLEHIDEADTALRAVIAKGRDQPAGATSPKPQIAHADICIERVIGGRRFRFRGFIRDDDANGYVLGDTMLERVRAIGDTPTEGEDNEHLYEHRADFDKYPELGFFGPLGHRFLEQSQSMIFFTPVRICSGGRFFVSCG